MNEIDKQIRELTLGGARKLMQEGKYWIVCQTFLHLYYIEQIEEPISRQIKVAKKFLDAKRKTRDGKHKEAARALFDIENEIPKDTRATRNMGFDIEAHIEADTGEYGRKMELKVPQKLFQEGNYEQATCALVSIYRGLHVSTVEEIKEPRNLKFLEAIWMVQQGDYEEAALTFFNIEDSEDRLSFPEPPITDDPVHNFESRRERDIMDQYAKVDQLPAWQQREIDKRRDDFSDTRRIP
jgi:hypothetical protein